MSTTGELLEAMKGLSVMDIARESVKATTDDLIAYQQRQMSEGKGKNRNIGRYRNPAYAQFKNSLNPLAGIGNVDLKLTGSFYEKMTAQLAGDEIEIDSTDPKSEMLASSDWYGGQIWGLNAKNQSDYNENAFLPEFQAQFTEKTGLKFS